VCVFIRFLKGQVSVVCWPYLFCGFLIKSYVHLFVMICYGVISSAVNLTNHCNANCSCAEVHYEPICSHDHIQYYSPCHAGCLVRRKTSSLSVLEITVTPHHITPHRLSYDDCLEDKRKNYQNCSVLCCVVYDSCAQRHGHTYEQFLKLSVV